VIFRRLRAEGFRNLAPLEIEAHPEINWIHGDNGQGKTNLLESLLYPVTGRSHRRARDEEALGFEAEFFFLAAVLEDDTGESFELTAAWSREEGKRLKRDGQELMKLAELMGLVGTVVFGPRDVELVGGLPELRRRFLDYTLSKIDPNYLRDLLSYKRVLRQRNSLLRTGGSPHELEAWTTQLVEFGAKIHLERVRHLKVLARHAGSYYQEMSGEDGPFHLTYRSSISGIDEASAQASFQASLEDLAFSESLKRNTLAGPHRDDMRIDINGRNARKYASQGQKRSVAIALKLAQAELLDQLRRDRPVVVLDDVFSELDPGRRERLCALVGRQYQTFLATPRPDSALAGLFPASRVFTVQAGHVMQSE
jgi:DNA replication and repair protein RecF